MDNTQNHNDWHQADIIAALRKRGTTLACGIEFFDAIECAVTIMAERGEGDCAGAECASERDLAEPLF